ncbi:Aberrant root formation protein 4 [Vitis vinifera]|uniref:Aberrant root formation protein 4 n=1 Tax=Vitis vinifera TaxID=29760 RepID=A0A438F1D4_VITVI|nr:Aberrant root formation protein 4 [Vitis vinifera]
MVLESRMNMKTFEKQGHGRCTRELYNGDSRLKSYKFKELVSTKFIKDSLVQESKQQGKWKRDSKATSSIFLSIPRRHFEQVKEAVPVILSVLKAMTSELDDEDTNSEDLFARATSIANSIQTVCGKLAGRLNEKLRALLGLFVLQIMVDTSQCSIAVPSLLCMREKVSSCLTLVLQLSHFLPYCGLSYLGLLTGCDVDTIIDIVLKECTEDGDDYISCFPYVKHGASLAVICGHMSNTVAQSAEEDLTVLKDALQSNQTKRWQAVGMLKHIFSSANLPWELKKHTINFLLWIMDGNLSEKCNDEVSDCSSYVPGLFASLQAIEMVIMYTSDSVLRRNAFNSFKKMDGDLGLTKERFRRKLDCGTDNFYPRRAGGASSPWDRDVLPSEKVFNTLADFNRFLGTNDNEKRKLNKSVLRLYRPDLVCLLETKVREMSVQTVRSLGVGRVLEWGAVEAQAAFGEIVRMALSGCLLGCMGLLEWGERGFMGRVGSNQRPMGRPMVFRKFPLYGGLFTWYGGLNSQSSSRLDHFSVSEKWEDHFSGFSQFVLPKPLSNHCPVVLKGDLSGQVVLSLAIAATIALQ